MFPSTQIRVVVAAAAGIALATAAFGQQGSGGSQPFATPALQVSAQPLYAAAPPSEFAAAAPSGSEPVLVPLPPGVWAAMSGLAGLALAAAWRKHRLREQ
jgi:hypothetical protein